MENKFKCEKCQDGILLAFNTNKDKLEIQKCDDCGIFKSDEDAYKFVNPKTNK